MGGFAIKVSVLLAAYNGSDFIKEQLDSFLIQTIVPDEVIIIDDCSTDNTVDIVSEYIKNHGLSPKWVLIQNEINKGWKRNFRDGIEKTTGDVIFFSDQDDIWLKNKIEIELKLLESDPTINVIGSDKMLFSTATPTVSEIGSIHTQRIHLASRGNLLVNQTGGSTMCFRRTYYEKIKKFYPTEVPHDDFFWKVSASDGSLLTISEPTILRRLHAGNVSVRLRYKAIALDTLRDQIMTATGTLKYVKESDDPVLRRKADVLNNFIIGNRLRVDMIDNRKIYNAFKLIFYYHDVYNKFRTFVGDIILTVYPKWRAQ